MPEDEAEAAGRLECQWQRDQLPTRSESSCSTISACATSCAGSSSTAETARLRRPERRTRRPIAVGAAPVDCDLPLPECTGAEQAILGMTGATPAAVTYVGLPVSSGGAHSLGRMSRRTAFEQTVDFLRTCTQPVDPLVYTFKLHAVPELEPLPLLERALEQRFGDYVHVPEARVPEALAFLDEIDPQPTNRWGMAPLWFRVVSKFRILDPATGRPVLGQDPDRFAQVEYEWSVPLGTSGLRLILHNQAAVSIELCIPDADEDALHRLVPWLEHHLPFKFSPKHWRTWTPTKSGGFKGRRMPAPR